VTVVFPDAPLELPKRAGDALAMRTWWNDDDKTKRFHGWDTSLNSLRTLWKTHGPFVGVIGFSQGAAVAFLLALLGERADRDAVANGAEFDVATTETENTENENDVFCSLDFFVLCAGYVPAPSPVRATGVRPIPGQRIGEGTSPSRSCFVVAGEKDEAVPLRDANKSAAWFAETRIFNHPGAHEFPNKKEFVDALVWFVEKRISSLTTQLTLGDTTHDSPRSELVSEEIEVCRSIFDSEMTPLSRNAFAFTLPGVALVLRGNTNCDSFHSNPSVVLELPAGYPETCGPNIRAKRGITGLPPEIAAFCRQGLDKAVSCATRDLLGEPCLFVAVNETREFLERKVAEYFSENKNVSHDEERANSDAVDDANTDDVSIVVENDAETTDTWWEDEYDDDDDEELVSSASETAARRDLKKENADTGTYPESPTERESNSGGGRWDYVLGLVGKPSAGKSTFFNSAVAVGATDFKQARVAAFPFTTIEPNIALALAPVPCACRTFHQWRGTCAAAHGRFTSVTGETAEKKNGCQNRLVPVTIKDVAGLVPGAHRGKGRGNAFLNDLCNADVLIHVVDVSGRSDREGVDHSGGGGDDAGDAFGDAALDASGDDANTSPDPSRDPAADIAWVRHELHRWIFGNVRAKWHTVRRRPSHLRDLFTGYHCPPTVADAALKRCGIDVDSINGRGSTKDSGSGVDAENVFLTWSKQNAHDLVAHFLRIRFPILLALNKSDLPMSKQHVERVKARWPGETAVVISAKDDSQSVRNAVAAAVALKPPTAGFVVDDLETGTVASGFEAKSGGITESNRAFETKSGGTTDGSLRHCILLKPSSTVGDFFNETRRSKLCPQGELVRCETVAPDGTRRVVRKNTLVATTSGVVRFFVNRKVKWQGKK
jgi:ribosome-binding ATPase YchF (GTP1/OBG family)